MRDGAGTHDREHLHRPQQCRETQVDFVKFDPMTIEFELTIGPPQIRQLPLAEMSNPIAGTVNLALYAGHIDERGAAVDIQVTRSHAGTADQQFSCLAVGDSSQVFVNDVEATVEYRAAEVNDIGIFDARAGSPDRSLRRTVHVVQQVLVPEQKLCDISGQRFSTANYRQSAGTGPSGILEQSPGGRSGLDNRGHRVIDVPGSPSPASCSTQ
ncbi:hypothetical protein D3C85_1235360 [compost metagenome]